VANEFFLTDVEATTIVSEVEKSVSQWRKIAKKLGIPSQEIERMNSAFEI
jgi:hypothetical protein